MPVLHRRLLLGASAAALLAAVAPAGAEPAKGEPIYLGVSGPLTGPNAQYGAQWKKGFDLALDEINGSGGIKGRPLAYVFEDSQSDPRQSVAVAQKFVADPKIVVELGDFSSPASMAASPIYQRGQAWCSSASPTRIPTSPRAATTCGATRSARPTSSRSAGRLCGEASGPQAHRGAAPQHRLGPHQQGHLRRRPPRSTGAEVVAVEGYLPDEKDFRSTLVRVRDAKPDGLMLISYYSDARADRPPGARRPA